MSRILMCTHRASAAPLPMGEKKRGGKQQFLPRHLEPRLNPILSCSCGEGRVVVLAVTCSPLDSWARWAIHKGPYSRRRIADKASGRWTSR